MVSTETAKESMVLSSPDEAHKQNHHHRRLQDQLEEPEKAVKKQWAILRNAALKREMCVKGQVYLIHVSCFDLAITLLEYTVEQSLSSLIPTWKPNPVPYATIAF